MPIRPQQPRESEAGRCGDVRNPTGRNQSSKDRERSQAFRAICKAIDEGPEEVREAILGKLAALVSEGTIAGDKRLAGPAVREPPGCRDFDRLPLTAAGRHLQRIARRDIELSEHLV